MKYQDTYYIISESTHEYLVLIDDIYVSHLEDDTMCLNGFVIDSNNKYLPTGSQFSFYLKYTRNVVGNIYIPYRVLYAEGIESEEYLTLFDKIKAWFKR